MSGRERRGRVEGGGGGGGGGLVLCGTSVAMFGAASLFLVVQVREGIIAI